MQHQSPEAAYISLNRCIWSLDGEETINILSLLTQEILKN